jgi:UDP-2-acetamido-2-deoxy-ribo-hexuluronate aminotransferase
MEAELAQFVGMRHCLSCASGTDALLLALMALDFKAGQEVIVPSFTFVATAEVVALLGGKPVFVDSEDRTYNIDVKKIAEKITPETRGIIAVDIFGQAADYDEINALAKAPGLWVIQDGAQSFGAQYKGRRDVTAQRRWPARRFSPAKPLGCYGDGGAVFVDDDRLFAVLESLRVHGKGSDKYDNVRIGINGRAWTRSRPAVIQAKNAAFRQVRDRPPAGSRRCGIRKNFRGCASPRRFCPHNRSVWAQYCVPGEKSRPRDRGDGQTQNPHGCLLSQAAALADGLRAFPTAGASCPCASVLAEEIMALPMHP